MLLVLVLRLPAAAAATAAAPAVRVRVILVFTAELLRGTTARQSDPVSRGGRHTSFLALTLSDPTRLASAAVPLSLFSRWRAGSGLST
jgi:hypothetical protein